MMNFDQRAHACRALACFETGLKLGFDFLKEGQKGRIFLWVENFYVYGTRNLSLSNSTYRSETTLNAKRTSRRKKSFKGDKLLSIFC